MFSSSQQGSQQCSQVPNTVPNNVLKFPTLFPTMFSGSQPCSQQISQVPNHVPKDSKGEFGLFYLLLISAPLPGALGIRQRDEYCLPNTQGAAFSQERQNSHF